MQIQILANGSLKPREKNPRRASTMSLWSSRRSPVWSGPPDSDSIPCNCPLAATARDWRWCNEECITHFSTIFYNYQLTNHRFIQTCELHISS